MSLPNTSRTNVVMGGKPEGDPINMQFQWANDQGKLETKTGTVVGTQTVQAISNDNDEIIGSSMQIIVDVNNDGYYALGPNGVTRKAD